MAIEFRPDDLPADVFEQVRGAGGARWQDLDEDTRRRGVGKLRLTGVYDDRQEPRFMLRTRIPGGVMTADQVETVAGVARELAVKPPGEEGPDRFVEITTRQDLQISYGEHLETYAETDRAPVTPPGHRSHHYEVSC